MSAALIGLGISAIGSAIGAIGSSVKNRKAQEERTRSYEEAKSYLDSLYYRDPLSTVGNRALLKSMDERMKDQTDALNNRMVAGGATMENQLAARESNNRTMGNVYTSLLQGEDARRDRIDAQRMQLDQQYSQGLQQSYLQDAMNWQSWGSAMAQAGLSYGSTGLLDGYGAAGAVSDPAVGAVGAIGAPGNGVQFAPPAPARTIEEQKYLEA